MLNFANRMTRVQGETYRFGEFELNCARRELLRSGETLALSGKVFDLLAALVAAHGAVVSKEELLEAVWPGQFVEENNLTVQISALRKALGGNGKYIATVPGRGYSFVAPVELECDDILIERKTFERITIEDIPVPAQLPAAPRHLHRFWRTAAAVLAVLLIVLVAAAFFIDRNAGRFRYQQVSIERPTKVGKVANAALSPDGKLYAYTISNSGGLWIGNTAGGEPRELRPDSSPGYYRGLTFSPDGVHVYYVLTGEQFPKGSLFRVPVYGGVPEKLRDDVRTSIDLSPDAGQFATVKNNRDSGRSSLMIAATAGGEGKEIVSRPLKQPFEAGTAAWSADGKTIAVAASDDSGTSIYTVPAQGGELRPLSEKTFRSVVCLKWLADGEGIMMIAAEDGKIDRQLWHIATATGEARLVNPDLENYGPSLGVSADGSVLLTVPTSYLANLWVAQTENPGQARQITTSALGGRYGRLGVTWMPDGRVVYNAFADKSQPLWTMNPDGTGEKKLTPEGYIDINPSVTADGQTVVFSSNRGGGKFEVWAINSDGSGLRQLTYGDGSQAAAVSPDGKWVFYVSERNSESNIIRVSLDGTGDKLQVTDQPSDWVRVSPDSRYLACSYTSEGKTKLAVIPIDGGPPVRLFDLPASANLRYGLRWSRDGTSLGFRDWENGYWRQSLDGGPATRLEGFPEEKLFSFDWSPDGSQIAFSRGLEIRDVVLIKPAK